MIHVVLVTPEIPPNTGNIIRLCANTGASLHLVRPLGFPLDDARMRRAGLDYHEYALMQVHDDWVACRAALAGRRMFAMRLQPGMFLFLVRKAKGSRTRCWPTLTRSTSCVCRCDRPIAA